MSRSKRAASKRSAKQQRRREALETQVVNPTPISAVKHSPPELHAQTETQGLYISTILHSDISFGIGPAGTGKTYVSAALACEALLSGEISQIVLTRPAVDVESFGALPGELEDKYAPYLEPFMYVFKQYFSKGQLEYMIKAKKIVGEPLAFMRGKTYDNAWILFDEAQNATIPQVKMVITRLGKNSKLIISGDNSQKDLPRHVESGLKDAVIRLSDMPEIGVTEFVKSDCVRHGLLSRILERYGE